MASPLSPSPSSSPPLSLCVQLRARRAAVRSVAEVVSGVTLATSTVEHLECSRLQAKRQLMSLEMSLSEGASSVVSVKEKVAAVVGLLS